MMKGLYFSINKFYTKILFEREIPSFYCALIISLTIGLNIISLRKYYYIFFSSFPYFDFPVYYYLVSIGVIFVVVFFYFRNKRLELLDRYENKKKSIKTVIYLVSFLYVLITVILYFQASNIIAV